MMLGAQPRYTVLLSSCHHLVCFWNEGVVLILYVSASYIRVTLYLTLFALADQHLPDDSRLAVSTLISYLVLASELRYQPLDPALSMVCNLTFIVNN